MSDFISNIKEANGVIIIETNGYLNNDAGEQLSKVCLEKIADGSKSFLLNMNGTKVVNSIGVSILIEIIEKLQEVEGKIGYYNLAPIVSKTFNIMGLTKYSTVFDSEENALSNF